MKTFISWVILVCFIFTGLVGPYQAQAQEEFRLPAPGSMVHLSPEFNPPILKGIKVHPDNPFRFDFILDKGDGQLSNSALKDVSSKLIKYFLASLTIPEKDLWVNLSPYEKDRIIPQSFGLTEMGRDLLAEDYMLKQVTASLIYPEGDTGKKFWKRIYEEARKKFGTTNIPVNTFNKVWIVPEKAVVYENAKAGAAYVVESKLKVMLEQDYLSLQKHEGITSQSAVKETSQIGSQIVREIVIPELTKEVNEGKNFSQLRQVYNSLILATWYKKKIKDSILEQVYADKSKVAGVNIDDPKEKEKIYQQYLKAFKKGVYNYIKEDIDLATQETIPRKYFSGGADVTHLRQEIDIEARNDKAMFSILGKVMDKLKVVTTQINPFKKTLNSGQSKSKVVSKFRSRIVKTVKVSSVAAILLVLGGYSYLRWGYDVSPRKMFTIPTSEPEILFQGGRIIKYNGDSFQVSSKLSHQMDRIKEAVRTKKADREFWEGVFNNYPQTQPVSSTVTLDLLRVAFETKQLDNLFNGLRTQPELAYRYLSEIPDDQMQEFSHYFSKLKPGTRQQVFEILYRRLAENFQVLENGETVKSILYKSSFKQAERMRRLYGEMMRILNVIRLPKAGEVMEGPLVDVSDFHVAPYEDVAFTKEQAADGLSTEILRLIEDYHRKGYAVMMPVKKQVNIGDIEGLISHYSTGYMLGMQSYYIDNKAGLLLQWVQEKTSSKNPSAHRITQKELIEQAFKYAEDPESKKVDMFNAIASISHLFKSLARNPELILGANWVMEGQDGMYYIWNHFQPNSVMYSLYADGAKTVDDQGRPVMFWRSVDPDGNDSIPLGQRTGIQIADSSHDFYHGWGMLLMSIYTPLKSLEEIKMDLSKTHSDISLNSIYNRLSRRWSSDLHFGSVDMDYLPVVYKMAKLLGIEEFGLNLGRFSGSRGSAPEIVFNRVGARITEFIFANRVTLDPNAHPRIATIGPADRVSFLKSMQGGLNLDQYVGELNRQWEDLRKNTSETASQKRARLIVTANQILNLENIFGTNLPISSELRTYLYSSVISNRLSTQEILQQLAIFKGTYVIANNSYSDIKAPFIYDLISYSSRLPDSGSLEVIKQQVAHWSDGLLPETYQKFSVDPNAAVREALAGNKNLPQAVRDQLLGDINPDVVRAALAYYDEFKERPLAYRLRICFDRMNKYPQVDFEENWDLYSNYFAYKEEFNFETYLFVLFRNWSRDNLGKKMPQEVYDLLLAKDSLLKRARKLDERSLKKLNNFKSIGDFSTDVRAYIKAIEEEILRSNGKTSETHNYSPGGIDLTSNKFLQTQNSGESIKFHLDSAQLAQFQNAPGFVPVIINIQPLKNLSQFFGLSQNPSLK